MSVYYLADGLERSSEIVIWYGDDQRFGRPSLTQKYVNILGTVKSDAQITASSFSINGKPEEHLHLGPDLHRLARIGDFNIELETERLVPGTNVGSIRVLDARAALLRNALPSPSNPTDARRSRAGSRSARKRVYSRRSRYSMVSGRWPPTEFAPLSPITIAQFHLAIPHGGITR